MPSQHTTHSTLNIQHSTYTHTHSQHTTHNTLHTHTLHTHTQHSQHTTHSTLHTHTQSHYTHTHTQHSTHSHTVIHSTLHIHSLQTPSWALVDLLSQIDQNLMPNHMESFPKCSLSTTETHKPREAGCWR